MELFRNVNNQIVDFVANDNSNLPEDKVCRFVCGNLFIDRLNEFHGKIGLLKDALATGWSVLMAEMPAENNLKLKEERLSFGGLSALSSAKYRIIHKSEKRGLQSTAAATNAS